MFLDLPVELRILIIENSWRCTAYSEQRGTHSPSNCLSLLLTCLQLSAETQHVSDHLASNDYHLEIALLTDTELFPTWLCVPKLMTQLSTLHVDLRLFGHIIADDDVRLQVGCGGHLGFHWSFYALLERFLTYGPVDEKKYDKKPHPEYSILRNNPTFSDRNITIRTLVLDISSAEQNLPFPGPESTPRPEWIAAYMEGEIEALIGLHYDWAKYAKILYQRIGKIRMLVDGGFFREWNLVERRDAMLKTKPASELPEWM
ncbi:hypothetical protein BJX99DRAFT_248236 [Aspergillus californicus]